eukprot:gnl/TRDRNA2_/TRDRNA2_92306_c0_seq1.p1 gnl/TRDRNA2_/TRDRNA2_92306_c0~~gnl/TRDRNA2_/TRDRNA2_92306_c0_seq1.p1  ORF type:complete len:278 (-),score=38.74 gnl/TRDRNA2_/TRDRNA2_92306_c0_seq1:47-793(-)
MTAALRLEWLLLFGCFSVAVADGIDWSRKGMVPPVHNQGACGSSAVFAVVDAVTSAFQIETGRLVQLSMQQVQDCATPDPCKGDFYPPQGLMDYISKKGLCSENDYIPQPGNVCADSHCTPVVPVGTTWRNVTADNVDSLRSALEKEPVVVSLNASPLRSYTGGIFSGPCDPKSRNDAMLLVGHGQEATTGAFWKVKAAWGANWGEQGFALLIDSSSRPVGGECGLLAAPFYPVIANISAMPVSALVI